MAGAHATYIHAAAKESLVNPYAPATPSVAEIPTAASAEDVRQLRPPLPDSPGSTGLDETTIADLLLKTLHVHGVRTGQELIDHTCLPFPVVDGILLDLQQRMLIEVQSATGHGRGGYRYGLAPTGRARAMEAMQGSTYVGPAPVPLDVYTHWVHAQSAKKLGASAHQIAEGLRALTLHPSILRALGPAINSGRSMFLYGAPGNGKTAISECVAEMMGGDIWIPHAIEVDGQVITLFDPVYHEPVPEPEPPASPGLLTSRPDYDRRFIRVRRPTVLVGGELTLDQLDLQYDPVAKIYKAPFQLKSAGGVLILDDFGRQRVEPRELLNRWVVPLERGVDFLTLHTGVKFPVPFDCRLIFATNLDPGELVEEAFLRRIHYKIRIGNPDRAAYTHILQGVCDKRGIQMDARAVDFVWSEYYDGRGVDPRACHPRDIVDHLEDFARYRGEAAALEPALLRDACDTYFLKDNIAALTSAQEKYAVKEAPHGA